LPRFTPSYACELENIERRVELCMVHASETLAYPCAQTESVSERVFHAGTQWQFIQHDYRWSAGCWTSTSTEQRSLRICEKSIGQIDTLANDALGEVIESPDHTRYAYVAAESGSQRLKPHIFLVRFAEAKPLQLDTLPFPIQPVIGLSILGWSADSAWVEVSTWDGSAEGYHRYYLATDGSGSYRKR
jgi:hypothetical protein